jgi:hypothetical protein
MNSPLMVIVLGLTLVMASSANAYDPVPDPRMSKSPAVGSTIDRGGERDAGDGGYQARPKDRDRRGEPRFGSKTRRGSGYEYGSGGPRDN